MNRNCFGTVVLLIVLYSLVILQQCLASKKDNTQQIVQKVGKINLTNYGSLRQKTAPAPAPPKPLLLLSGVPSSGNLREVEWEHDDADDGPKLDSTPAPKPTTKPVSGQRKVVVSGDIVHRSRMMVLGDRCDRCVPDHHLQHYRVMNCTARYSRECDCAKYFRCTDNVPASPVAIPSSEPDKMDCEYGGKRYNINEIVPVEDKSCQICRCRRDRLKQGEYSAKIDCSLSIECPEMVFGVTPKSAACYFGYQPGKCCGIEICPEELEFNDKRRVIKCRHQSRQYRYGEVIETVQNPCRKCFCNEHWNDHQPETGRACQVTKTCDQMYENSVQGCTPVYNPGGCCPLDYVCPQRTVPEQTDHHHHHRQYRTNQCLLNGQQYPLGAKQFVRQLDTKHKRICADCDCLVPPLFTCTANFDCKPPPKN